MQPPRHLVLALCLFSATAFAGRIENGVLLVDGRPFFPLSSWNFEYTAPEDIARLGMNASFRGGPSTEEAVERFRGFMRECRELEIQVIPYVSYGGAGIEPWPPDAVRQIAKLATEPNLLAWYVGDDIGMPHLPGIRQTVDILREETPGIPTVADYIAKETPQAKTVFTEYIDIRCQYYYPIPDESFEKYLTFFDEQREFVGDPLWTWVQNFMWGKTGSLLNVGAEGPGPIPEPEQVRLLSFAAVNRGVRGLLYFAHHQLHRLPELAAEVALTCREIGLVSEHLAAGTPTYNLSTSDANLSATAFRYGDSTVISVALFKPFYHRWVDEGVVQNVTIQCPWESPARPHALLVATPEVVECPVAAGSEPGTVALTLPSLELAGFVLLSTDENEMATLRSGAEAIPNELRTLIVSGASSQVRKVNGTLWQSGSDNLYAPSVVLDVVRSLEECANAADERDFAKAVKSWRETLRGCRVVLDDMMKSAQARREMIPPQKRRFLISPYGLHNIKGLASAPAPDDPWQFAKEWMVTGPFPLEWDAKSEVTPAGFDRSYPPESHPEPGAAFETVDGPAVWRFAESDLTGLLDFLLYFETTDNMVCYARTRVLAPRDMAIRMSLGSNDGARAWINGEEVFSWCSVPQLGRSARPHQDEIEVHLKEGSNEVLVKVENLGANWQLYLAFHDPDRELQFEAP